jgi:deoxyribose-phosphate aldolase
MDWQGMKAKVTDEVIRQLQAEGLAATPEKVQQLVVSSLGNTSGAVTAPAPALPTCEVGADFKTDVLVVVAGPVCDQVVAAIKAIAASRKVTVVSSGHSQRLAEMQPCGQLIWEGNDATARRLVQGAGAVVVPVISTTTAAKVGSLIGDCLASAVLVQAALQGKQVVAARESIDAPAGANWAIRRKVEEVVGTLRTLGFTMTDLPGITAEARKAAGVKEAPAAGAGAAARPTGGYVPAYRAVQAARATRSETAGELTPDLSGWDKELALMIDHTLLKPEATAEQVTKLCKEAREYGFMSVCVNPTWVPLSAQLLQGSPVKVCTVIGFPLGATTTTVKALEAADAVAHGATEVDMVLNVGALKSGQYDQVLEDVKAVVAAVKGKALVKVILETGLLTGEEKVKACELCKQAGADFVKTSTGFGPGGATVADIALMRKTVGPDLGVKASGGVRDYEAARALVKAGATRIGASASINIVKRVKPQAAPGKEKY